MFFQKSTVKIFVWPFLISMLFLLLFCSNQVETQAIPEKNLRFLNNFNTESSGSITISSDNDLLIYPGNGNETHPYIIDGYNISMTAWYGFHISYTTKHFTIQNCYIEGVGTGIYMSLVASGTVTLINNTINTTKDYINYGMEFRNCDEVTIIENKFNSPYMCGLRMQECTDFTIFNNTFLYYSIEFSGYDLIYFNTHNITENWIRNKRFGFFKDLVGTTISDSIYNQLIIVNCESCTITNQIISDIDICIELIHCLDITIIDNTCTNSSIGIHPIYSEFITVTHNNLSYNNNGLVLTSSSDSLVSNNLFHNNSHHGTYISSSENVIVSENTYTKNEVAGISLYGGSYEVLIGKNDFENNRNGIFFYNKRNLTIINNTFSENTDNGIYFTGSDNNEIINNTFMNNFVNGIYLDDSQSNQIWYNHFLENQEYGVYLNHECTYNKIHHNSFINNNLVGTSQGFDDGINNTWYDTTTNEGNYWNDLSGSGSYLIDGTANAEDLYPLNSPDIYTKTTPTIEGSINYPILLVLPAFMLSLILYKKQRRRS